MASGLNILKNNLYHHMTPDQFCYWLQGLMELQNPKTLNETQVQSIKDHLATICKKVTPIIINCEAATSTYC